MSEVVWNSFDIKVIKQKSARSGYRYTIWDDTTNEEIVLYRDNMLDMCHSIIQDAESESEDA